MVIYFAAGLLAFLGGDCLGNSCCGGIWIGGYCEAAFWGAVDDIIFSFSMVGLGYVQNFLVCVSPLSLRLWRFMVVYISSSCSPSVFFSLFFFLCFLLSDGWTAIVSIASFSIVISVVVAEVVALTDAAAGDGDSTVVVASLLMSFFFLLVTWVHPSSVLFGWFSGSGVFRAFSLSLLVTVVVLLMMLAAAFYGQLLARCQNCSQDQHSSLLPSTTTIICWSV